MTRKFEARYRGILAKKIKMSILHRFGVVTKAHKQVVLRTALLSKTILKSTSERYDTSDIETTSFRLGVSHWECRFRTPFSKSVLTHAADGEGGGRGAPGSGPAALAHVLRAAAPPTTLGRGVTHPHRPAGVREGRAQPPRLQQQQQQHQQQ